MIFFSLLCPPSRKQHCHRPYFYFYFCFVRNTAVTGRNRRGILYCSIYTLSDLRAFDFYLFFTGIATTCATESKSNRVRKNVSIFARETLMQSFSVTILRMTCVWHAIYNVYIYIIYLLGEVSAGESIVYI